MGVRTTVFGYHLFKASAGRKKVCLCISSVGGMGPSRYLGQWWQWHRHQKLELVSGSSVQVFVLKHCHCHGLVPRSFSASELLSAVSSCEYHWGRMQISDGPGPRSRCQVSMQSATRPPGASEGASPAPRIIDSGDRDRPSYGDMEGELADGSSIASLSGPVLECQWFSLKLLVSAASTPTHTRPGPTVKIQQG